MTSKENKKTSIISTKWLYFVIFLILNTILWMFVVHFVNDPTDCEVFNFFIGAYSVDTATLKKSIQSEENYPKDIRRFYVREASLNAQDFDTQLKTYGLVHSDLLVLPKNKLDELPSYASMCAKFSLEYAQSNFPGHEYLMFADSCYGIKIYDHESKVGNYQEQIKYTSTSENSNDFYIVFKSTSVHLGDIESDTKTNYAITIAKDFINHA